MATEPKEFFDTVFPEKLQANPDISKSIGAKFQFNINGDNGGTWVVDMSQDPGVVSEGAADDAACTITMAAEDFVAMMSKTANPMQLYMSQKLKVEGNLSLSLKLQELVK